MRYPKDHKIRTRERILTVAAGLFRRHGYDGVSIDTLMEACGLTRGGFYGHFASKQALYRAVLEGRHGLTELLRDRKAADPAALAAQAECIVSDYLEPAHRSRVIRGCSLASLAMDTSRTGAAAQKAYARAVRELADELRRGMDDPGKPRERSRRDLSRMEENAMAAIATCVGGLLLSSACAADRDLSDAISAAARKRTSELLGS